MNDYNQGDKLLRKKQVADMLACSARTVERLTSLGKLTRIKVLGGVRYRLSQVELIIKEGVA